MRLLLLLTMRERRSGQRPQLLLLVDDTRDLRQMWRVWLALWRFTTAEATNGAEAITLARRLKPSLILMDLRMPHTDGAEAVEQLKRQSDTAEIPVIGVTAEHATGPRVRKFRQFCDVVLQKPVDLDVLLQYVRRILRRRETPIASAPVEPIVP